MSTYAATLPAGRPAVLYLRRSTDRQEQSIDDQRTHLVRYAAENGYEIVGEYVDDGISGTSADARAAFQRLIRDAQGKPRFRHVLCYDLKRFSRGDGDEVGYYRYLLRQAGIEVIYTTQNFGDDFVGEILRPILQVQARQESVDLSKVTIRGQVSAVEGGSYICGVPPSGFDLEYRDMNGVPLHRVRFMEDGSRQMLVPETGALIRLIPAGDSIPRDRHKKIVLVPSLPERVEAVRYIFRLYVQEGLGYRAIANRLNSEGVPSPRRGRWGRESYDGRWGISTIKSMLCNQTFAGDTVWSRTTHAKFHRVADGQATRRERHLSGKIAPNPRHEWIITPNTHEPIIDRALFDAAQKLRRERDETGHHLKRPLGRGYYSNFMLSGLIECGECHHKFMGYSQKYRQRTDRPPHERPQVYLCGGYVTKGRSVCRRHAIEKVPFEQFILDRIHARLVQVLDDGGRDVLRAYVREELQTRGASPAAELHGVESELARIKADVDRLLESLTPVNREFVDEKLVELKGRRRELEARREALQAATQATVDAEEAVDGAMAYLGRFRDVLEAGTLPERKQFIGGFVEGITLYPSEMRGELRMYDVVAASFSSRGWSRPKLYRLMARYGIASGFGKVQG